MLLRQRGRHPLQPLLARCGLYPLIRLMMRLAGINWHQLASSWRRRRGGKAARRLQPIAARSARQYHEVSK
jgi:hypothetical protein